MADPHVPEDPAPSQWGLVIAAWIIVGVPLLWGVWNTLVKASALFR
jgi:hypothetical protein